MSVFVNVLLLALGIVVPIIGPLFLAAYAVRRVAAARRHARLASALLDMFADAATSDDGVAQTGIEVEWLALKMCGHPVDARVKRLPTAEQARVIKLSCEIAGVGAKMVKEGILDYFRFTTNATLKPHQKLPPAKSLFILTDRGRAMVLERRAEKMGRLG